MIRKREQAVWNLSLGDWIASTKAVFTGDRWMSCDSFLGAGDSCVLWNMWGAGTPHPWFIVPGGTTGFGT
jgi:hypothetical protein